MRRTKVVTITDDNRDKGKSYILTEFPCAQAEKWATRAMMALIKTNPDLPSEVSGSGMAGIAMAGFLALGKLDWDIVEPLMDEMWTCVTFQSSSGHARPLIVDDVEEIATRLKLRMEVFELHTGFLLGDLASISTLAKSPVPNSPTS